MSCRRYPYQLDGKLNARFCPFASQLLFRVKGPDIKTDPMVRELELHKRIVKEWNKKPGKRADCLEFLLRRAKAMRRERVQITERAPDSFQSSVTS